MKRYVHKLLSEVLGSMYQNGQIFSLPSFELDVPKENFGDYSTNVAFALAKEAKVNPLEAAQIIARELMLLDKGHVIRDAKPVNGFVNIFINPVYLSDYVLGLQNNINIQSIGITQAGKPKKVLFEYSSPNTNKPLHIGHTRNDVYGSACINLLKATGHEVVACEVINDRGIHIMKSVLMYIKHGADKTPQSEKIKGDHFVGRYYVMFSEESAKSEQAKEILEAEAQELLRRWEAGDKDVRDIWQKMNDWFFEGLRQTYLAEGSHFDHVDYEHEIYDKGKELVLEGLKKGIFQKEEDGSVFVDLTEQGMDKKYLLRKDGTTLYMTQDLYLWDMRAKLFSPDLAIATTSSEQSYHFNVLAKVFTLLGYDWAKEDLGKGFKHLAYEHVYLGKSKMSSRAGNTITADELLETIKGRVQETMRNSKKIRASAEDPDVVEAVAWAAIKYGYLKYDRNTKIYFDLDETIAVEGNTGPYLQYAYARIYSILKKSGFIEMASAKKGYSDSRVQALSSLPEGAEQELMRYLMHYEEVIISAILEYKPNLLCSYLFELASKFNLFYDKVSVLNAETEQLKLARLDLLGAVAKILAHGLGLLGIKVLEEM